MKILLTMYGKIRSKIVSDVVNSANCRSISRHNNFELQCCNPRIQDVATVVIIISPSLSTVKSAELMSFLSLVSILIMESISECKHIILSSGDFNGMDEIICMYDCRNE